MLMKNASAICLMIYGAAQQQHVSIICLFVALTLDRFFGCIFIL